MWKTVFCWETKHSSSYFPSLNFSNFSPLQENCLTLPVTGRVKGRETPENQKLNSSISAKTYVMLLFVLISVFKSILNKAYILKII